MFATFKKFGLVLVLALVVGAQSAMGFALLGPKLIEHVLQLGYSGDFSEAPHNLGDEFRWNTPIVYYTCDQSFLDYFGSNGVLAVDQAFTILNNLTNFSTYSSDLSEFSQDTTRFNATASAMHLYDLKSGVLEMMVEHLGLADPERYTWTLRNRVGDCTVGFIYTVIRRNFDPITLVPSSYVNGDLLSYRILDNCNTPGNSFAIPFSIDPLGNVGTAVASAKNIFNDFTAYGLYYTGLTRDDVGGLRYLMGTNNINWEAPSTDSLLLFTNQQSQLLVTSNLATLVAQSYTNDSVALATLYPGLVVTGSTNFYTNVITTNFVAYFTNGPFYPAGTFTLVLQTNRSTNVQVRFRQTFANVVTNTYYTKGFMTFQQTNVTANAFGAPGSFTTNIINTTMLTNFVNGDFYIVPTNLCGYQIIANQLTSVITLTNSFTIATNQTGNPNPNGLSFSRDTLTYFTNHSYIVYPIECRTNAVTLRQGIDKITFIRKDFDSLLGRFFAPITNTYRLTGVTNGATFVQTFRRVINKPDILFTAADIVVQPLPTQIIIPTTSREIPHWNTNNVGSSGAGPGTIDPVVEFTLDKVGPIYDNPGSFGFFITPLRSLNLDESSHDLNFIWASFDGTTNAPIVYPVGTSITNLVNQIFMQVNNSSLPDGRVGFAYHAQLEATGGQVPYTWSLSPDSNGLPVGLNLSPDGVISGSPTTQGIYDIFVRVTDVNGRVVDRQFAITINP
ncbi:MAG: Ig family protein [Pedosphaera sp.]|nr:Ig family protein [Pedosphaera sp.]